MDVVNDALIQRVVPDTGVTLLVMVHADRPGQFRAEARWMPADVRDMSTHDNGERRRAMPLFSATAETAPAALGAVLAQLVAHHAT